MTRIALNIIYHYILGLLVSFYLNIDSGMNGGGVMLDLRNAFSTALTKVCYTKVGSGCRGCDISFFALDNSDFLRAIIT